jgi:hypothetical protein
MNSVGVRLIEALRLDRGASSRVAFLGIDRGADPG